jgi:hypothetical protein
MRVNRRSIAGHVSVQTAVFEGRAILPAGDQNQLTALDDGRALLTSEFDDRVEVHEIGVLGASALVENHQLVLAGQAPGSVNLRSAAAGGMTGEALDRPSEAAMSDPWFKDGAEIPGVTSVLSVPGFADAPVAIATVENGPNLLLDLSREGSPRVAGTFTGPIGALLVVGEWALAANGTGTSIYRALRSGEPKARGRG